MNWKDEETDAWLKQGRSALNPADRTTFYAQVQQKAMRAGSWKYLSLDGDQFLFDLSQDQRERANHGGREPGRLAAMRARYAEWEATMPALPPDAMFFIPYTKAELAQPS